MNQTKISGKAFVLGDDVDTDQIIPAEYLAHNPADPQERKYFGMYAMSGVPPHASGLPGGQVRFVEANQFKSPFKIIIGGKNFGCGSSREHAPLALAEAGAQAIVAEFYARIFFRNCVNGGYVLPCECKHRLSQIVRTGDECTVELDAGVLTHNGIKYPLQPLGDVEPIIDAGGIFKFARSTNMI